MKRILVICGAGMTSSILVSKMRSAVSERENCDYKIGSCAVNQMDKYIPQADIVFIAPHLSYTEADIRSRYTDKQIIMISTAQYGHLDAQSILEMIEMEPADRKKKNLASLAASAIGNSRWLKAISAASYTVMPVLLIGSMFTLVCNFPFTPYLEWIRGSDFYVLCTFCSDMSVGMISVYMTFMIAYHYGRLQKSSPMYTGLNALICYFLLLNIHGGEIELKYLGMQGLFCAFITAFVSAHCFILLDRINRKFTDRLKSVPPAVYGSFFNLIPLAVSVMVFLFISTYASRFGYASFPALIYSILQTRLSGWVGNNLVSLLILQGAVHILWFFGVHGGQVVGALANPLLLSLSMENVRAFQAGETLPNIVNDQFARVCTFGGAGSTLALVVLMVFLAKSRTMKEVGRIALPMGVFFINEPVILGLPIMMNVLMLFPFVFIPLISCGLTYIAMYIGMIPRPAGFQIPWTTPILISGLIQGGWKLALWQIFMFVMQMGIWYPFFRIQDRKYLREENNSDSLPHPVAKY